MNKKVLGLVLGIIILVIVVSGVSYWFIGRDKCQIDKGIKYSYYDYSRNNEFGMFQTLGVSDNYKIVGNYGEYVKYYEFLKENVRFSEVKLYDKDFFEKNNLIVIDIYEYMACNASLEVNNLSIKNNILNFKAEYKLPMFCGGGLGIGVLVEVPKNLEKVNLKLSSKKSGFLDNIIDRKPVLYLYPEEETMVKVNFEHPDYLTTTYPKYNDGWQVIAKPNGDLRDKDDKYYYALYWEEKYKKIESFDEGFYVASNEAIDFLEEKLDLIGLNEREKNEFIMYWLPVLEENGKSLIYFELTEEKENYNRLIIEPKPDSLLRVTMHVKRVDSYVAIKEQKLETFKREGFVAIEWGGMVY